MADPPPAGTSRGPVSLLIQAAATVGWATTNPITWVTADGRRIDVRHGDGVRVALRRALESLRWQRLAARRRDFGGAQHGVDEHVSFQGARKALAAGCQGDFGSAIGVLAGGRWTRSRLVAAGYLLEGRCQHCAESEETVLHRLWHCPRWAEHWVQDGIDLKVVGEAASWQPTCLWECGLLPVDDPEWFPPAPPEHEGFTAGDRTLLQPNTTV